MSIDGSLKYWKDGEPVICDDDADIKALKYWKDGEPMSGLVYYTSVTASWVGTINGISLTNITKINGISLANITKINGIASA